MAKRKAEVVAEPLEQKDGRSKLQKLTSSSKTRSSSKVKRKKDCVSGMDTKTTSKNSPNEKEMILDVNQPRLTDILLVEHAIKTIQTSIDSIIQSSPDEEALAHMQKSITDKTLPQMTSALTRYKLKLAAKLKTMYNNKQLEIFDQILNFEKLSDQLKAPASMEFEHTLQFTPASSSSASLTPQETAPLSDSKQSSFGAYDKSLPLLPEIRDPAIRARVFIHKSLIKDKLFLSKREQLHSHNERLEFLGDSVLNNMMTQIAYHRFPDAAEGYLSVLRTKLISNATLMRWSSAYGLDKELKKNTPEEQMGNSKMKIYADVFEAYIGGLMTENPNNYSVVFEWLKQLAEPILKENEPKKEARSEFRANAKMELYSLIGTASLGLHYDCVAQSDTNPVEFTVKLFTGAGDLLGTGRGPSIKLAGTKAAMDALDNKELIEKYSLIRANTPRDASKVPPEVSKNSPKESTATSREGSTTSDDRQQGYTGQKANSGNFNKQTLNDRPEYKAGSNGSNRDHSGNAPYNRSKPQNFNHSKNSKYGDRF